VIEKILVERGDKVQPNQPVALLRSDLEQVALELAEARAGDMSSLQARRAKLAFAARKLDRNADLARSNVVSANDLDSMRTDRDVAAQEVAEALQAQKEAQIELRKARVELDLRTIRSPVAGVVTERKLAPGDLLRDQPIAVIQRIDPLFVEVSLPVELMGKVVPGGGARIVFDLPGAAPADGRIALADAVIDAASDTFAVRIILPNPAGQIPAGGKCHVEFFTN
jgi:RND family efflux transporter MFP subunit